VVLWEAWATRTRFLCKQWGKKEKNPSIKAWKPGNARFGEVEHQQYDKYGRRQKEKKNQRSSGAGKPLEAATTKRDYRKVESRVSKA